ncbi:MAG: M1 family metallopeptidase [Bacteroidia bacterium]|nr:M1 family metallopeptidase [Bacteroidia bacterium]
MSFRKFEIIFFICFLFCSFEIYSQRDSKNTSETLRFKQLREELPTPTESRLATGAPGPKYWQNRADYSIDVTVDDINQLVTGKETITYHNFSPHTLTYLWVQLDQNIFASDSRAKLMSNAPDYQNITIEQLADKLAIPPNLGYKIEVVQDSKGRVLKKTIYDTMMRIDLPTALLSGQDFVFSIHWNFKINDGKKGGRCGYEFFESDGNYIYELAQWFPRMCVYDDVNGWQHKSYLGRGEFALEFGDYTVNITVPNDHIVAATGILTNPDKVLTTKQLERYNQAKNAEKPIFIVTPEEATENQQSKPNGTKTWRFFAKNVRDFAFATSRKFVWDAASVKIAGNSTLAMSFYPKEGMPLWDKYSTHTIIHTLKVYSRYSLDYPYPVAISVNGPVYGMEYPMICFNGPRPEKDKTYSKATKYALISVIIHEVGHNFFPMIISSDERQWTWLDEGLNSFIQFLTEREFEPNYPSRRGFPSSVVPYMSGGGLEPIMTNSESISQFGNNAYLKPAVGLNILRETIMGRELFDYAFKEYCQRWKFKHPEPADFFRTLEDASGVDLDWFWRGWFFETDPVNIGIQSVTCWKLNPSDPNITKTLAKQQYEKTSQNLTNIKNDTLIKQYYISDKPELKDFYNQYDEYAVTNREIEAYRNYVNNLSESQQKLLQSNQYFYVLEFNNAGGMLMPIIIQVTYKDGSKEVFRFPVELWVKNTVTCTKEIISNQEIIEFQLDPFLETADIDTSNNVFPRKPEVSRFELFRQQQRGGNPMQYQTR